MKEHKTITDGFAWIPLHKLDNGFGGPMPPKKPETRIPILWLARDRNELFLVNNSQESLEIVIASSGGFLTADDDVVTSASQDPYEYRDVNPNDAVKVDEYDGFYDLDYVLQVYLRIISKSLGCIEVRSPSKKGGVDETVLLWDTGEAGKNVWIKQCNESNQNNQRES